MVIWELFLKCCLYNSYRSWLRLASLFFGDSGEHQAFSWSLAGAVQSTTSRWICIFSLSLGQHCLAPCLGTSGPFQLGADRLHRTAWNYFRMHALWIFLVKACLSPSFLLFFQSRAVSFTIPCYVVAKNITPCHQKSWFLCYSKYLFHWCKHVFTAVSTAVLKHLWKSELDSINSTQ